jgi:putative heme-binding domain-containing protein
MNADPAARADAIGLAALAGPERNAAVWETLIAPSQPELVQSAAVRAYGKIAGDGTAKLLMKKWRSLAPAARGDAADAMFLDPARERLLLSALQSGEVQPWMLAFRHKRRLIMHTNPAIRDAARPILEETPAAREAVAKRYEAALDAQADAARGREVFRSVCAKCHKLEGNGAEVGPDLLTVKNQPKQWMLTNILIPSGSIAQGYESYVVETPSGAIDGVIGAQSAAAVTLRHEDGKEDVIRRQDIRNMYVTNLSAMPGDIEKQVSVQQMADLLEYLKTVH